MLKVVIAGRAGRNAEHRTLQNGTDICNFSVAVDVGWGENKRTEWIDVSKFGKGAEGLSRYIKKGDSVTVLGDLSTREHNGKTYLQCRADEITLQGGKQQGLRKPDGGASDPSNMHGGSDYDDLNDDIPF